MTGARRPLATRELTISKRVAVWLARTGATPNGISVAGMVAGLCAGAALWRTGAGDGLERVWFVAGAALVQLRLLANMFDGMVAVDTGRTSPLGELYNEVPDRVSDVAALVGLGYAMGGSPALGFAAAIAAVATAYVRAQIAVAGGPQEFCGPMAKPQRMFLVTVTALYCGLAPTAWQWTDDSGRGLPALACAVVCAGSVLTAIRRLMRGARALRGRH